MKENRTRYLVLEATSALKASRGADEAEEPHGSWPEHSLHDNQSR